MIVYDVATKLIGTELLPRHNITDWSLTGLCHCFVESAGAFTVKENTHAHARTHARTHTHTHTEYQHLVRVRSLERDVKRT